MNRKCFLRAIPCLVAVFFCLNVHAASPANLKLALKGFQVQSIEKKGKVKEKLRALPKEVTPGSIVQYEITATNTLKKDVMKKVAVEGKIPKGTRYISKSASRIGNQLFSIDDGQTFSREPVHYIIRNENNQDIEKIATPDMYTTIRWIVPQLKANKKIKLTYRVKVTEGEDNEK